MADLSNPTVQKILQSTTIAHLATIGPDGRPQSSPRAFHWDGEYIKLTTTVNRQKYQNIKRDPHIALSITDVDNPYTYAEFRGVVERIEEDPAATFYLTLAERYGIPPRGSHGDLRVILEAVCKEGSFGLESHVSFLTLNANERLAHSLLSVRFSSRRACSSSSCVMGVLYLISSPLASR